TQSLTAFIGGIQSGRISHPPLATTQEDFKIDQLFTLQTNQRNPFQQMERQDWARLLSLLEASSDVQLDGEPVRASGSKVNLRAEVVLENGGFRLKRKLDSTIQETFQQGIVLSDGVLKPVAELELSS